MDKKNGGSPSFLINCEAAQTKPLGADWCWDKVVQAMLDQKIVFLCKHSNKWNILV
jgi:hypothetical protein